MAEKIINKYKCFCCGNTFSNQKANFYIAKIEIYKYNSSRTPVCYKCVNKLYDEYTTLFNDKLQAFKYLCALFGWYYSEPAFRRVYKKENFISEYIQKSNTGECKGKTFENNILEEINNSLPKIEANDLSCENSISTIDINTTVAKDYEKNKNSIIRSIGYDPFMSESENDKALLYWMLENLLDEPTIEDPFKLPCVIQIVKNFGQLEHLNKKISNELTSSRCDPSALKALISAKDSLYSKTLAIAKDNGISIINSNTKSKGAGTLSGKIRELYEIGLEDIFVNTFDIETSKAMIQIAEISSQAVYANLKLDENEYTNIISEQRKIIEQKDKALAEAEENYRLAMVKLAKIEAGEIDGGVNR